MTQMNAKVTVRGTPENPVFDFELPTGPKGEPGGFNMGTSLGTTNLNFITTPGLYWQSEGTYVTEARNYPSISSGETAWRRGILEVISWGGSTYHVVQRYTAMGGRAIPGDTSERPRLQYIRWHLSGGSPTDWSQWTYVATTRTLTDTLGFKSLQTWDSSAQSWTTVAGPGGLTGAALGSTNLNELFTPGEYHQWSSTTGTIALGYPRDRLAGTLRVWQWTTAPQSVVQEFTFLGNGGTVGSVQRPRVTYQRYFATQWSDWSVVVPQRVDNTAGRAIYTWDETTGREQLTYGDTGWLNVPISKFTSNNSLRVRRVGYNVEVVIMAINPAGVTTPVESHAWQILTDGELPVGFRPSQNIYGAGYARLGVNNHRQPVSWQLYSNGSLSLERDESSGTAGSTVNSNSVFYLQATYTTTEPWPKTLPGTALGSIPNI